MMIGAVGGYNAYPGYDQLNSMRNVDNAQRPGIDKANEDKEAKFDPDKQVKAGRKSSPEDCETCKNRKYQDGSDEANVSFKAAAHVSPQSAGAAVRAHEQQHVSNAYKKAAEGDGKVISANVTIHTAICPECGTSYVSGGVTKTTIAYRKDATPVSAKSGEGNSIDYKA